MQPLHNLVMRQLLQPVQRTQKQQLVVPLPKVEHLYIVKYCKLCMIGNIVRMLKILIGVQEPP